jgi:CO dehydrogenase/acetyl-CoA synthase delta subunit
VTPSEAPELKWSENDPRWRFLVAAAHDAYAELEHGDKVLSLTVNIEDSDFTRVTYAAFPHEHGVRRYICTDPKRAGDAFDDVYADATPEDSPELAEGDRP